MEKCDSPVVLQRCSLFFFSFIEEPRINAQKEPKRGTLWKSWVFRTLPGFIKDETQSGSGRCPDTLPPFEKGGPKLLDCFATAPSLFIYPIKRFFFTLHTQFSSIFPDYFRV